MDWFIHFHLFAAIAWIGGSIFMFVLGVTLTDKQKQREVYPHIGPIFGYFEVISLIILVFTGIIMIKTDGLLELLLNGGNDSLIIDYLTKKLILIFTLIVATIIHFVIAFKTNTKERTKFENFLSRGTSMYIFFVNLFILHYAIMIRSIMS